MVVLYILPLPQDATAGEETIDRGAGGHSVS